MPYDYIDVMLNLAVVYLAAMNLVVMADDAFSFLVSWEFMSLTSWALVISNHELRENMMDLWEA